MTKEKTHVSEEKKQVVSELTKLAKEKKTILIASIKNIPGSQFQEIVKKLRGKAIVKVPKKNLIFRALDSADGKEIQSLKDKIGDSFAILFSDLDPFKLAGNLMKYKSASKAKPGQIAPKDIEIEAGPTELIPGPAISELGAIGLQVKVENGKLTIKESKVVVKEGEKIKPNVADVMSKLDIKPFSIGFTPICAFDNEEKKLYANIKIDKEKTIEDLKYAFGKALPFAVEIGYITKDTITFMIGKAGAHANKINRIMTGEPEPVAAPEGVPSEEGKADETKKEEEKAPAAAGLGALFG